VEPAVTVVRGLGACALSRLGGRGGFARRLWAYSNIVFAGATSVGFNTLVQRIAAAPAT